MTVSHSLQGFQMRSRNKIMSITRVPLKDALRMPEVTS